MEVYKIREEIASCVKGLLFWYERGGYPLYHDKNKKKALEALNLETCSSEDIDRIVGGSGAGPNIRCDECHEVVECAVQLGGSVDGAQVCLSCLKAAVKKLEGL